MTSEVKIIFEYIGLNAFFKCDLGVKIKLLVKLSENFKEMLLKYS